MRLIVWGNLDRAKLTAKTDLVECGLGVQQTSAQSQSARQQHVMVVLSALRCAQAESHAFDATCVPQPDVALTTSVVVIAIAVAEPFIR